MTMTWRVTLGALAFGLGAALLAPVPAGAQAGAGRQPARATGNRVSSII